MEAQEVQQAAAAAKKKLNYRTIALISCTILLTIFAVKNWKQADVWPLGSQPVFMVILISFVLGSLIGWLARSITGGRVPR